MRYAVVLALATAVSAQSITDLPSCSLACVANGVTGVGCTLTDFECSCSKADQLTPAITPCVQSACPDAADQQEVITTLAGICASAGFPITVPEPGASSSAAPVPEPSSQVPTIQTSAPTPSLTDIVVTDTSAPVLPTAPSDESCVATTITDTVTVGKPSAPPAPYPSAPVGTGAPVPVPAPSGTGAYTPSPPLFTGAAAAVKVPVGVAGVLGLAAYLL